MAVTKSKNENREGEQPPTMVEVAKLAGDSQVTVSMVLNDRWHAECDLAVSAKADEVGDFLANIEPYRGEGCNGGIYEPLLPLMGAVWDRAAGEAAGPLHLPTFSDTRRDQARPSIPVPVTEAGS